MSLDDIAWIFVAVVFTAITCCTVWIIREERKKK